MDIWGFILGGIYTFVIFLVGYAFGDRTTKDKKQVKDEK